MTLGEGLSGLMQQEASARGEPLAFQPSVQKSEPETGERIKIVLALPWTDASHVAGLLPPGNDRGMDIVSLCQDGSALTHDATEEYEADVVVLSPEIPRFDAEAIQQLYHYEKKPIITIAAVPAFGDWAPTMERAGAKGHITLPFNPEKVSRLVAMIPPLMREAYQERTSTSYIPKLDTELAEAVARRGFQRQLVCCWAPKGGVGKTLLAVNMACLLGVVANRSTLLIDADMNGGNVNLHLALPFTHTIYTLAEEFRVDSNLSPTMVRRHTHHFAGNLEVLAGIPRMHQAGEVALRGEQGQLFMERLLDVARRAYDFVVVDLGQSFNNPLHLESLIRGDLILLVVTSDRSSIADARGGLEVLSDYVDVDRTRFQLVVNQFAPEGGVRRGEIQTYLGLSEFGVIPLDTEGAILRSVNQGQPVVLSRSAPDIADALAQLTTTIYPPLEVIWKRRPDLKGKESFGGWLKRVLWG